MEEWKRYRLGDICTIYGRIGFRGYTTEDLTSDPAEGALSLSPTNIVGGELDLSKPTYIKWDKYEESPEIMLHPNDVVIVKTGSSVGRTTLIRDVTHPLTLNPQLVVLKDIKINPVFLSYLVKSSRFQGLLKSITVGSAIPTLSQKNLANLPVDIPNESVQRKIADILNSLDKKILLNNRINHNLEEQAQALYKSWFVDFEPFKGGKFVDSDLGIIPEGWSVQPFLSIAKLCSGGTPKTNQKEYWNGSIPFFTPKDVGTSAFCLSTEKTITEEGLKNCNSSLYKALTTFITARGTVGKLCMAGVPMAMNQTNYAICPASNIDDITLFLITKQLLTSLKNKANGAVFDAITTRDFDGEKLVIAPQRVMDAFSSVVHPIYDCILQNELKNASLSQLRDSLLPRLISGQLSINKLDS